MSDHFSSYASVEQLLNLRFRGHAERNWEEWRFHHAYDSGVQIPLDANRAWLSRRNLNYRGVTERRGLRHLIAADVDQPFLEEIASLRELERLELEWPMVANDLSPLLQLDRLAFLSIDSPRKIVDFEPLLRLPSLRSLIITNAKNMAGLDWLREAHHLEVIGVEGGTWSPYTISSLAPLAGLRSLRAFLGVSTKLADKRLMHLVECPRLEFLSVACFAPREEFERLHAARPALVCDWFRPGIWTAIGR